jgi:predicted transcriptional regulator of viral defense system
MISLSEKEMKFISKLEFEKKYFFTIDDIIYNFSNKIQLKNTMYRLVKKGRVVKINKNKYYFVPLRSYTNQWSEDPFIIADEMMDGANYYIGGFSAANYWKLTDQIPVNIEIGTNRRNGRKTLLNTTFVFHKTTKNLIDRAVVIKINNHNVRILNKEDTKKWLKSRNF